MKINLQNQSRTEKEKKKKYTYARLKQVKEVHANHPTIQWVYNCCAVVVLFKSGFIFEMNKDSKIKRSDLEKAEISTSKSL